MVRGSRCGCAGVCPRRTRAWSQRGCPRACGNVSRKGRRGEPAQTLRQSPGVLPAGHHVLGPCPLPRRPRLLTDSNPSATGPSVPRLPGQGRRVRPPTRSSLQAPPGARHMEGQACEAHRGTQGQAPRPRPGPAPGKCGWATGGYSPKGLAKPPPRAGPHPAPPTFPWTRACSLEQQRGRPVTRPEAVQCPPPRVPASPLGSRGRVHAVVRPRRASPT